MNDDLENGEEDKSIDEGNGAKMLSLPDPSLPIVETGEHRIVHVTVDGQDEEPDNIFLMLDESIELGYARNYVVAAVLSLATLGLNRLINTPIPNNAEGALLSLGNLELTLVWLISLGLASWHTVTYFNCWRMWEP